MRRFLNADVRFTIFNLLGLGLPLLLAVFCVPILILQLGTERFGILTLIWAVVSYFGLFDVGIGKALAQVLAAQLATKRRDDAVVTYSSSMILLAVLGCLACIVLAVAQSVFDFGLATGVDNAIREEVTVSIWLLALSMPVTIVSSGLRGVLEAQSRFISLNMIRLPLGVTNFLAPTILCVTFTPRLDVITASLVLARMISTVAYIHAISRQGGLEVEWRRATKSAATGLIRVGGWYAVSAVLAPLMGYLDRFAIGAVVSASAVAYYVTPQELITKLWIVPGAVTSILLPRISQYQAKQLSAQRITELSLAVTLAILTPIVATLFMMSEELLGLWIDENFAMKSHVVLEIMAIGILINCAAHFPLTALQGTGNAKLAAGLNLLQFPVYVVGVLFATSNFGIAGTAVAWLVRNITDALLLFLVCYAVLKWKPSKVLIFGSALTITITIAVVISVFLPRH